MLRDVFKIILIYLLSIRKAFKRYIIQIGILKHKSNGRISFGILELHFRSKENLQMKEPITMLGFASEKRTSSMRQIGAV